MTEKLQTSRIASLDITRAVCIILVAIGHFCPENAPMWYKRMVDIIYTFHMPAFLFISGYVYVTTRGGGQNPTENSCSKKRADY